MQITEFTSKNVTAIQSDINAALLAINEKYGITLQGAGISWQRDGSAATFKVDGVIGAKTNVRLAKAVNDLERYKFLHPDIDFDATYEYKKTTFTIVGYSPKARTQPFIIQLADSSVQNKTTAEFIKACHGASK